MSKQRCCSDEIHTRNLTQTNNTRWIKISIHMLVVHNSLSIPSGPFHASVLAHRHETYHRRTALEMDKGIHPFRCLSGRFLSISLRSILHSFWTGWHIYCLTPKIRGAVWSRKERDGAREGISFIESLTAMQKGIVLSICMNFLYDISTSLCFGANSFVVRNKKSARARWRGLVHMRVWCMDLDLEYLQCRRS